MRLPTEELDIRPWRAMPAFEDVEVPLLGGPPDRPLAVAVDGRSGSGKSTTAGLVQGPPAAGVAAGFLGMAAVRHRPLLRTRNRPRPRRPAIVGLVAPPKQTGGFSRRILCVAPALDDADFTDNQNSTATVRITGGSFRLLHHLFVQIERVLKINDLSIIATDVVEPDRNTLDE